MTPSGLSWQPGEDHVLGLMTLPGSVVLCSASVPVTALGIGNGVGQWVCGASCPQ